MVTEGLSQFWRCPWFWALLLWPWYKACPCGLGAGLNNTELQFFICQTEIIILDLPITCGFDVDAMSWILMLALNVDVSAMPEDIPQENHAAHTNFAVPKEGCQVYFPHLSPYSFRALCCLLQKITSWSAGLSEK